MIPLVSIYSTGPYILPGFFALLTSIAVFAGWLIDLGIRRKGWRRYAAFGLGVPLACMVAIIVSFFVLSA